MSVTIIRGDVRQLPLPDASVDLIVTSPPYFGLRSYTDGGEHYAGQIGSEATPAQYVAALLDCTREWVRVLKPSGSLFVNLGDKYTNRSGTGWGKESVYDGRGRPEVIKQNSPHRRPDTSRSIGMPEKTLMGLPWRYALACIDDLGLILRAEIIWAKPNCLSGGTMVYAKVKGRPTTIKVHDLCRHYAPEQVQLWNGQQWTQVLWWQPTGRHPDAAESMKGIRAARRRGDEPVVAGDIEIELRSGERIGCTREHRWPTQRGLVNAAELVAGDVLGSCPMPEGEAAPAALDDEMVGWFVGLYIAEGSRGSDRTIQIAGHVNELERYKRLRDLAEAFHGTCTAYPTKGNAATINLTGRFLEAIIETYVGGRTAKDKFLRPACWQRSNRFLRAVLEGYLSGDGHWRQDSHQWVLGFTDNDALAADLRALGARLGLSVRLTRCTHTGFGREWPGWRGTIARPEQRRKPDSEIVAIRQSRARQFWDIGVEDEPHLFALASGVLTHNSLPESVTDRVRRSHEQVFHFTRQPRYYSAVDEVREAHVWNREINPAWREARRSWGASTQGKPDKNDSFASLNPLGKLPGSVWEIASQPLTVPARLGVDHFACVDNQTEILTPRGWLRHDQLAPGDQVAGYDLDTCMARWTDCSAVSRYDYDGDLIAVESRDLSMRLTPNHRTVVQRMQGRSHRRSPISVVRADELDYRHFIPRSAAWERFGGFIAGPTTAAVMGWVAAEGWYQGTRVWLSQSLDVNAANVAEIDKLIPDALRSERKRSYCGKPYTEVCWRLGPIGDMIQRLMPDKLLPWWIVLFTEGERRAVLEAFINGDGHRRADGRIGVFQKHRHNLDVLQAIAVTLGYKTTIREGKGRFVLYLTEGGRSVTLRGTSGVGSKVRREHYKGTVWCPTTGTGTFIARRNGSVFVTGNSFPMELPRRIIAGWSPPGICTACGEGRRPVVDSLKLTSRPGFNVRDQRMPGRHASGNQGREGRAGDYLATLTGYACACWPAERTGITPSEGFGIMAQARAEAGPPPTRPAIVLDPFSGTGTTLLVADALGRHGIGVDRSADYCRLARWRTADPGERAKAWQVDKPPPVPEGQEALFA